MIYLCKCGARKSGQPYKSAVTRDWICESCANRILVKPILNQVSKTNIRVASKVRTLEMLKKTRIP